MPRVLEAKGASYFRVGLFGEPGTWKTRLATSLPWGKVWGEKAIYVCADPGSEELAPVLLHNREHLIKIGYEEKELKDGSKVVDPYTDSVAIASRPWNVEYPEVGTLIWDTMTATGRDILHAAADSGVFSSEKHISMGQGKSAMNDPMQGDYKLAQGAIFRLISFLFKQPLNIICVFHAEATENSVYGPKTVGKATIRDVAGVFDFLLHTELLTVPKERGIVHAKRRGQWLGKLRTPHDVNPLPMVELPPDPREYWEKFEKAVRV